MIKLTDLPGGRQLQARLEMLPHQVPTNDQRSRELLAQIVGSLGFKLNHCGGWLDLPEFEPGEAPIDVEPYSFMSECDEIAFWKARGWDICDSDGQCVRFFNDIVQAMIVIQEGRGGRSKVGVEAKLWAADREHETRPAMRHQDRAFLELGQRQRTRA